MSDRKKFVALCGPTAVGKTEYAIGLAREFNGEIVSCDSMQLYKYMDIGSAKPSADELKAARHHLVDEIDPRERFSAAEYEKRATAAIYDILGRDRLPIIAGGTGLYLNSLIYEMDFSAPPEDDCLRASLYALAENEGPDALFERLKSVDPAAAERIHPNNIKKVVRAVESAESGVRIADFSEVNKKRTRWNVILICLVRDREELYDRINRRVDILMEKGLVEEVRGLQDMGLDASDISMKGIGYKEIIGYLNGEYDLDEAVRLVKRNTRHYAKRQLTWFRRYDDMKYFNASEYPSDRLCLEDMISWLRKEL